MPSDWLQALIDPSAGLPASWPTGALGAFLLFFFPVGGGIPLGVLMARDAGVPLVVTALMYLLSDVYLALTNEPFLMLLRWLGRRIPVLGGLGRGFIRLTGATGLDGPAGHVAHGIILVAFALSPTTGRAAAAAAGHGFIVGWALAIIGDMGYFGVLMASTLWLSDLLGDTKSTIGIALLLAWLLPTVLQRLFRRQLGQPRPIPATTPGATPAAVVARFPAAPPTDSPAPVALTVTAAGRAAPVRRAERRPRKGLHRRG